MKRSLKKILIFFSFVLIIFFIYLFLNSTEEGIYSYEWVKEKDSTIGQYRLYVNDKNGKHIDGKVRITYLNGNSEKIYIKKEGNLYIKKIIKKVSNPKKR